MKVGPVHDKRSNPQAIAGRLASRLHGPAVSGAEHATESAPEDPWLQIEADLAYLYDAHDFRQIPWRPLGSSRRARQARGVFARLALPLIDRLSSISGASVRLHTTGMRLHRETRQQLVSLEEQIGALRQPAQVRDELAINLLGTLAPATPQGQESRVMEIVDLFRKGPVLDLRCDTGGVISILKHRGLEVIGVDSRDDAIAWCRHIGLDAHAIDWLAYLSRLEDGVLGGIFSPQIFERVTPERAVSLMREAFRVLAPGGCLVIELIDADYAARVQGFWLTNVRPVRTETLKKFAIHTGFTCVEHRKVADLSQPATIAGDVLIGPTHLLIAHTTTTD